MPYPLSQMVGPATGLDLERRFDMACLAQSAERKALNPVVVGSSPKVGVFQERLELRQSELGGVFHQG